MGRQLGVNAGVKIGRVICQCNSAGYTVTHGLCTRNAVAQKCAPQRHRCLQAVATTSNVSKCTVRVCWNVERISRLLSRRRFFCHHINASFTFQVFPALPCTCTVLGEILSTRRAVEQLLFSFTQSQSVSTRNDNIPKKHLNNWDSKSTPKTWASSYQSPSTAPRIATRAVILIPAT